MTDLADTRGILICKDLFFVGSVTATARSLGLPVRVCPGLKGLEQMIQESPRLSLVILDLSLLSPTDAEPWKQLRAIVPPQLTLSAFGSHVDTARFEQAQSASFDHVLPKSAFTSRMVEFLKKWMP